MFRSARDSASWMVATRTSKLSRATRCSSDVSSGSPNRFHQRGSIGCATSWLRTGGASRCPPPNHEAGEYQGGSLKSGPTAQLARVNSIPKAARRATAIGKAPRGIRQGCRAYVRVAGKVASQRPKADPARPTGEADTMRPRPWSLLRAMAVAALLTVGGPPARAENAPGTATKQASEALAAFDQVWRIVRDRFYDPHLHGLDWNAVRERYRARAAEAGARDARA